MKRDLPLALGLLLLASIFAFWLRSLDLQDIWVYDVQPVVKWDGKPSPEPQGEGWFLIAVKP